MSNSNPKPIGNKVAVRTHVGKVRSNNEDAHGHVWLADGSLLMVVADGMGGHEAGEVASALAVRVIQEHMALDLARDPRERMHDALLEANRGILEEGRTTEARGMGTTAIAALVRGREVFVGQVGDSRLYHLRRGQLIWRTLDHTRVQMLLDRGEIDEETAKDHPEMGMLTRALGHAKMADGRPLTPDVNEDPLMLEDDDTLVLSSDGLHDLAEDWEIGRIVSGQPPAEGADALVALALERGGHDNITVAVMTMAEQAPDFDPDFVPEWALQGGLRSDGENIEATFEDFSRVDGIRSGEIDLDPLTNSSSSKKWWILVGAGIVGLGLLAVAVALAVAGALYISS